ncbi:nitrate- and nitrite sensing domain-containing protein [Streptomyces sp. TRM 70361]|uniref:sensor histidine kinase n=1 Tax=Streptomyces sp. TRM 70361 TaxID=3116553 RepID=UPI002E7BA422|nr:nitrate- and nitrite sensing domain-containing protein [Streptomyces sp. TRM 70361]MEE1940228.1 nitrate- and nitrite sensing domain-containing protein [Streptomyces sp. TRM 70361]
MAPRVTVPGRQRRRTKKDSSRLESIRTALLILAVVPSVALAALWTVSTVQLGTTWQNRDIQHTIASRAAYPATDVLLALQMERGISAFALSDPEAGRAVLEKQRKRTDQAVSTFEDLSDIEVSDTYPQTREGLTQIRGKLAELDEVRAAVDGGKATQQQVYERFNELVEADLRFFESLGQTEDLELTVLSGPLNSLSRAQEMLSRQDALLARGPDEFGPAEYDQFVELVSVQRYLIEQEYEPYLRENETAAYRKTVDGDAWQAVTGMQDALLRSSGSSASTVLEDGGAARWQQASAQVHTQLGRLSGIRVEFVWAAGDASMESLLNRLVTTSAVGLSAVVVVVLLSLWLTSVLRRRVLALREEALELEQKLPDIVERLRRGENIDIDAEVSEVSHGDDDLGRLGKALNTARRSAIETAVRETEQHRGFERLLQRIARRTQLLIGLQLKKLDEMERRHEDPEVLEGLFDLDHLTARLRRYEENLVILGGGQPQRRWRRPVRALNVLRAALGEVRDYRRIHIEVEGQPWLSERAVGPTVHILAELMENATTFSKPPTPVEVRAGLVGRGLAVEIEDRGLGMEPEEYERINRLMAEPPRMDIMSRVDDIRLGLYVVARLAHGLGVDVELRPSVFGGTRAIVLIPAELIADGPGPDGGAEEAGSEETGQTPLRGVPDSAAEAPAGLPARSRGRAMSAVTSVPAPRGGARPGTRPRPAGDSSPDAAARPLPKRVRRASLAAELREPEHRSGSTSGEETGPHPQPARSGAAIGAFQRQSRAAHRQPSRDGHPPTGGSTPGRNPNTTEDPR